MLLRLIEDMNRALDENCYLAALSIALMLPDICGKAEFPDEGTGKRYKGWFDKYVAPYEKSPFNGEDNTEMPFLSGELVYQLRNAYLHQGNPNIEKASVKEECNKIDHFQLVIERKNEFDIYADASGVRDDGYRSYRLNIRRLCLIIGKTAAGYYKANKEKFDFLTYSILDWDEEIAKMRKWVIDW